ncbi:putative ABC transport system permease protein [Asanoa hainanensis]|uniref:Putative ABC transport system permease protein n=1 Tax=Asanoa hainanensis TaxID=560556 RepID=A0A239PDY8_9ACTN|nr:FtsX-like permease family protein [Asanoa hainanensis]SNT65125.1 putative ABC transport system permease protein [Asanoa hainanensis]
MSSVWRAARAAVRRRRMQTFVIGLVVLLSTTTIVVALALLAATSAPFDKAFARQAGPHAVALFDPAASPPSQGPGVAAAAGPFGQVELESTDSVRFGPQGPLTVVGRADPGGPVDKLDLWQGRWPSAPGEIVLNEPVHDLDRMPPRSTSVTLGGHPFTIVGLAHSLVGSADAWVTPAQVAALRPTATQMLYRFTGDVSTEAAVEASLATATAGLPLTASQTYLVVKEQISADVGVYVPFLATFGVLGLVVGVVIVGNVVSGAVVSGYRHIGILKALGFTPRQVVAVYLMMVSVPAVVGCVLGSVAGSLAAQPLLSEGFEGLGLDVGIGVGPWIWLAGLVGVPATVVLAALVPAVRAHRLSAAEAISAGSAPRQGRGTRIQHRLAGVRLPRSVSLGLGLPFARPGRTAFTVAAVLLGVTTVTFATGLADTLVRISTIEDTAAGQIGVQPSNGLFRVAPDNAPPPAGPPATTTRTDEQVEELLRGLPDAARVTAIHRLPVSAVGQTEPLPVNFLRGDYSAMGYEAELTAGRWMAGPAETVVPTEVMRGRGLALGDRITLRLGGGQAVLTVVGETMDGPQGPPALFVDWSVLATMAPDRVVAPWDVYYQVQLVPGGDIARYVTAVTAADPAIDAWNNAQLSDFLVTVVSFSSVLSLLLSTVAALGVFNTVVLNVRERRRDLGTLKSIGMTPRQVVAMVLTSMALVGVVGGVLGIPVGMLAHRFVVPLAAESARVSLPLSVMDVWHAPTLALLGLAGVVIALLGALVPARGAARLTIASVLHNE